MNFSLSFVQDVSVESTNWTTVYQKVFNITFCTQPESYMLEIFFWQMVNQLMATFLFPFSSHCRASEWEGIWNIAFCIQHKYIMLEMIGINVILKFCIPTLEQFTNFYARFWKIGSIYVLWDFQSGSCEPSTRPLFLYVILDIVLISQSSAKIWSNSI